MNEKVEHLEKSYRDYRTERQKVFGIDNNSYPNAHFSMHHPEEVRNYANLNITGSQVDEVSLVTMY